MCSMFTAVVLACFLQVADDENPFKKASVGDWVEYTMTRPGSTGKTKMTIVSKDEKEVVYEVTGSFTAFGREMVAPVQKIKVDLTKSYNPLMAANLQRTGVTFEKQGEGKEKVKLGEKEFETKWTKIKSTSTVNNFTTTTEHKMWFSKAVPLSGLVKMEITSSTVTTTLELIGSGSK